MNMLTMRNCLVLFVCLSVVLLSIEAVEKRSIVAKFKMCVRDCLHVQKEVAKDLAKFMPQFVTCGTDNACRTKVFKKAGVKVTKNRMTCVFKCVKSKKGKSKTKDKKKPGGTGAFLKVSLPVFMAALLGARML